MSVNVEEDELIVAADLLFNVLILNSFCLNCKKIKFHVSTMFRSL